MGESPDQRRHLLLIGPTRAASSALFDALKRHPDILASTVKEARFFLGDDPHLPRLKAYDGERATYLTFFPDASRRPEACLLEASPDYLFDDDAPARVAAMLPDAVAVVVDRAAEQRIVSWHRYARQQGVLEKDLSPVAYVERMVALRDTPTHAVPQPLRALRQADLAPHIARWREALGTERVVVVSFERYTDDPHAVHRELCEHVGIDPNSLAIAAQRRLNASVEPARPGVTKAVRKVAHTLRPFVHDKPWVRAPLRVMRRGIQSLAGGKATSTTWSQDDQARLAEALREQAQREQA